MNRITPSEWKPKQPADFIGRARLVAEQLSRKIAGMTETSTLKVLFWGPPGTGKSRLAEILASQISGHSCCIEALNGQSMSVERVRSWIDATHYRPLFGRSVKVVDEIDAAGPAAHNELRTYLDRMSHGGFIGTTNVALKDLPIQLQTRVIPFRFDTVPAGELAALLSRLGLPKEVADQIAVNCAGCVRSALLDAEVALG